MDKKLNIYGRTIDDTYIKQKNEFILYDLKIEIILGEKKKKSLQQDYFNKKIGHYFELIGENMYLPEGQPFSIYDIAAVLPLLAAKQRETPSADRISTDDIIAVPDHNCWYKLRIIRWCKRVFSHEETSDEPLTIK